MSAEIPGTGDSNDKENAREMQETQGRCMSAYLFLIPFSTIFIAQLAPPSLLSPYASLYDPYDLDVFPYNGDTHTPFPLSLLTTIHKIPRARSIGSRLWTT